MINTNFALNGTIISDRLQLKPIQMVDANFLFELVNTSKWKKYIGDRKINTKKDAEQYISDRMLPQLKKFGFSNNIVVRREDSVKIGICGILYDENTNKGFLGFAFLPEFEGKGYAFEINSTLLFMAQKDSRICILEAHTLNENYRAQKLLIKLGFQKMGKSNNDLIFLYPQQ